MLTNYEQQIIEQKIKGWANAVRNNYKNRDGQPLILLDEQGRLTRDGREFLDAFLFLAYEETVRANEDLGLIGSVTPTSQWMGTQALINLESKYLLPGKLKLTYSPYDLVLSIDPKEIPSEAVDRYAMGAPTIALHNYLYKWVQDPELQRAYPRLDRELVIRLFERAIARIPDINFDLDKFKTAIRKPNVDIQAVNETLSAFRPLQEALKSDFVIPFVNAAIVELMKKLVEIKQNAKSEFDETLVQDVRAAFGSEEPFDRDLVMRAAKMNSQIYLFMPLTADELFDYYQDPALYQKLGIEKPDLTSQEEKSSAYLFGEASQYFYLLKQRKVFLDRLAAVKGDSQKMKERLDYELTLLRMGVPKEKIAEVAGVSLEEVDKLEEQDIGVTAGARLAVLLSSGGVVSKAVTRLVITAIAGSILLVAGQNLPFFSNSNNLNNLSSQSSRIDNGSGSTQSSSGSGSTLDQNFRRSQLENKRGSGQGLNGAEVYELSQLESELKALNRQDARENERRINSVLESFRSRGYYFETVDQKLSMAVLRRGQQSYIYSSKIELERIKYRLRQKFGLDTPRILALNFSGTSYYWVLDGHTRVFVRAEQLGAEATIDATVIKINPNVSTGNYQLYAQYLNAERDLGYGESAVSGYRSVEGSDGSNLNEPTWRKIFAAIFGGARLAQAKQLNRLDFETNTKRVETLVQAFRNRGCDVELIEKTLSISALKRGQQKYLYRIKLELERLKDSIRRRLHLKTPPIVVLNFKDTSLYWILDGHHRAVVRTEFETSIDAVIIRLDRYLSPTEYKVYTEYMEGEKDGYDRAATNVSSYNIAEGIDDDKYLSFNEQWKKIADEPVKAKTIAAGARLADIQLKNDWKLIVTDVDQGQVHVALVKKESTQYEITTNSPVQLEVFLNEHADTLGWDGKPGFRASVSGNNGEAQHLRLNRYVSDWQSGNFDSFVDVSVLDASHLEFAMKHIKVSAGLNRRVVAVAAASRLAAAQMQPSAKPLSNSAAQYQTMAQTVHWYRRNLAFDLLPLSHEIKDGQTVLVFGSGTGEDARYLMELLESQGKRNIRFVLVDIEVSEAWFQYARLVTLKDKPNVEYYLLPKNKDGSFPKVSEYLPDLRVDHAIFENGIHLVPENQLDRTLEGVAEVMKPAATLTIGSGNIDFEGRNPNESVLIDATFGLLHDEAFADIKRIAAIFHDGDLSLLSAYEAKDTFVQYRQQIIDYAKQAESLVAAHRVERGKVLQAAPKRERILKALGNKGAGFLKVEVDTQLNPLTLEDYMPFPLVDSLRRFNVLPEVTEDELRVALIREAAKRVFPDTPPRQMLWTRFRTTAFVPSAAALDETKLNALLGESFNSLWFSNKTREGGLRAFDPQVSFRAEANGAWLIEIHTNTQGPSVSSVVQAFYEQLVQNRYTYGKEITTRSGNAGEKGGYVYLLRLLPQSSAAAFGGRLATALSEELASENRILASIIRALKPNSSNLSQIIPDVTYDIRMNLRVNAEVDSIQFKDGKEPYPPAGNYGKSFGAQYLNREITLLKSLPDDHRSPDFERAYKALSVALSQFNAKQREQKGNMLTESAVAARLAAKSSVSSLTPAGAFVTQPLREFPAVEETIIQHAVQPPVARLSAIPNSPLLTLTSAIEGDLLTASLSNTGFRGARIAGFVTQSQVTAPDISHELSVALKKISEPLPAGTRLIAFVLTDDIHLPPAIFSITKENGGRLALAVEEEIHVGARLPDPQLKVLDLKPGIPIDWEEHINGLLSRGITEDHLPLPVLAGAAQESAVGYRAIKRTGGALQVSSPAAKSALLINPADYFKNFETLEAFKKGVDREIDQWVLLKNRSANSDTKILFNLQNLDDEAKKAYLLGAIENHPELLYNVQDPLALEKGRSLFIVRSNDKDLSETGDLNLFVDRPTLENVSKFSQAWDVWTLHIVTAHILDRFKDKDTGKINFESNREEILNTLSSYAPFYAKFFLNFEAASFADALFGRKYSPQYLLTPHSILGELYTRFILAQMITTNA